MTPAASKRFRLLASVLSLLLLAALLAAGVFWWLLRRSLPALDGEAMLPGLSAAVTVERDALGVPTLRGATRIDVARALGYVHTQDRFFQMDLLRRSAAGELSELFGRATVAFDRDVRTHGFRSLARAALAQLPPEQHRLVDAYAEGVNAGLASLRARPFEYFLLRVRPEPWRPEDTMLVAYAMVLELQDEHGHYERTLSAVRDSCGTALFNFLAPRGTASDAALDGSAFDPPPLPGPDSIDLRKQRTAAAFPSGAPGRDKPARGSNLFALTGDRAADGGALLASDMHLGLRVPNIWYRASLAWDDREEGTTDQGPRTTDQGARRPRDQETKGPRDHRPSPTLNLTPQTLNPASAGGPHRVTGVTLPGVPVMVAGSNGRIAWAFANCNADTTDVVIVEPSEIEPEFFYRNGGEHLQIERRRETIRVKGGKPVEMIARWTIWGPIIGETDRGLPLVLRWTFHDPAAVNLSLVALETARDAPAALAMSPDFGIPPQNLIVAGRDGTIGWTIAGRLPQRIGYDGRLPAVWGYGDRRWDGWLPPDEHPRVVFERGDGAALWSGNQRPVGGEDYARLGDNGYEYPARARQIRDSLAALAGPATPRSLLEVQLDDRALFLGRWQKLLLSTLTPEAIEANEKLAVLLQVVEQWNGRAATDSAAYHLVRRWRGFVAGRALGPVFAPCAKRYGGFDFHRLNYEEPLWRLLQERPAHFLSGDYLSWDDLLLAAADDVLRWASRQNRSLAHLAWGAYNTARIRHPLSPALPAPLARLLDMPAEPLPGDNDMPRVQTPDFGASERFVVSPGREEEGIFHMPGGQSGHPLSPFYRAGHEAWARGEAAPFLPGPAEHRLILKP